ncbi:MAG TPA: hypothetical protein PKC91_14500 [Ignavibacteria bacterium]|nr:hypothetical protein [Ignavibacteria bacterium]
MNDTHPDIEKKLTELYSKLTPGERFNKMLSMCQTVREIILSQLTEGLQETEKRKRLFEIYYRQDFTEEAFEKLLQKFFPSLH